MLQWRKRARSSPRSPQTKRSITWTCAALCWAACLHSKGESTWQHRYLKATALLRNKGKAGPLRDSQVTTKTLFGSCAAQHLALAGGWALGFGWGSKGACGTGGRPARKGTTGNTLGQTCQAHWGNGSRVNYMKPWKQNAGTKSSWAHPEITWPIGTIPITIPSPL